MKSPIKCKRPRMTNHRGRTWDSIVKVTVNGQLTEGCLDTTWGQYVYFQFKGNWYKFPAADCEDEGNYLLKAEVTIKEKKKNVEPSPELLKAFSILLKDK